MIFKTSNYVPEVYADSRDYRVLLKLLGLVLSVFKSNIDSFPALYSADNCPDNLLPALADLVGYEYDDGVSISDNRIVVKYFPFLIHYRGSQEGIQLATALSLNTSDDAGKAYTLDNIIVEFNYDTGCIQIYYPWTDQIRKDLIEVVRPVGTFIRTVPSFVGSSSDELDVKDTINVHVSQDTADSKKVNKTKVGFSDTGEVVK